MGAALRPLVTQSGPLPLCDISYDAVDDCISELAEILKWPDDFKVDYLDCWSLNRGVSIKAHPAPADPERERIPWVLASDPGAIYADAGQGLSVTRASTSLRGPSHT